MNWAVWYYDAPTFPVLQAVYPDLENRFPEEPGFDRRFEQPFLQREARWARVEEDFWASTDPKSSLFTWKFADSPHAGAFLSKAVDHGIEPITFVSHDADDGAWQFLGDSMSDSGGCSFAFTIQLTVTRVWLNWPTCLWAGMRSATTSENRGFEGRSRPRPQNKT
jgi:hypothetical protein